MNDFDVAIVGSGFCGSIIAYLVAEKLNKKVLVVEKRNHIAGNMYDEYTKDGILIQKYGPHIFHTNNDEIYNFITSLWKFNSYDLKCKVVMDNITTPSPFNFQTIDDFYTKNEAEMLKERIKKYYYNAEKTTIVEMLKSEDEYIKKYAEFLFEKDYKLYTAKQWGISPEEIDVSVLSRVPVVFSYKDGYFDDKYQIMPVGGFTKMFDRILNHPNITVKLNTDALDYLEIKENKIYFNGKDIPVVYTGEIDKLFNYKHEKLPYRSLYFEYKTMDVDSYQDGAVVAYPQEVGYTRITEFKKLPEQDVKNKTTIAMEYPVKYLEDKNGKEPYYPIPNKKNQDIYDKYYYEANKFDNLILCGRLADYKYYNMDNAIQRAMDVFNDKFLK